MNKGKWKVIGCAVEGLAHIDANIPCQDKIARYRDDNISVIALADGAGSVRLSHFGAERVVNALCLKLAKEFKAFVGVPDDKLINLKSNLLHYLKDELTVLANELKCELSDLASTLMAVASDNENYFMLSIGDGVTGIFKNGKIHVALKPDITVFVTSQNALMHMNVLRGKLYDNGEIINGFVLLSDGAGESFYERRTQKLIQWLEEIAQECVALPEIEREQKLLYDFENLIRPRTLDDCSMMLMCREE
ncbi:MAG: protein phosphatase 2C domain-containing protein [Synergistaceae bacterium]|nr:protein phosphatase 2C domain-containing protein [Synergistaceae bacterium]